MADPFIGEIRIMALTFAVRDWAFCNGQLIPIAQNPALFSILGTIYGGDGRINFAVPDLRSRAPMHPGSGPGLTRRILGQKEGNETVTLASNQMPTHDHDMKASSTNANQASPVAHSYGASPGGRGSVGKFDDDDNTVAMHADALTDAGGGQAHENMQPFLTLNFQIALSGIFPTPN